MAVAAFVVVVFAVGVPVVEALAAAASELVGLVGAVADVGVVKLMWTVVAAAVVAAAVSESDGVLEAGQSVEGAIALHVGYHWMHLRVRREASWVAPLPDLGVLHGLKGRLKGRLQGLCQFRLQRLYYNWGRRRSF